MSEWIALGGSVPGSRLRSGPFRPDWACPKARCTTYCRVSNWNSHTQAGDFLPGELLGRRTYTGQHCSGALASWLAQACRTRTQAHVSTNHDQKAQVRDRGRCTAQGRTANEP